MVIPDSGAGYLLPAILAGIGIAVAILLVLLFLRILRAFRESSASLIALFRSLAPSPEITLDRRIRAGVTGSMDLTVTGRAGIPLEQVLIVISSGPGLELTDDHVAIPVLGAGEQKVFTLGHAPAAAGSYPVRISVRYQAGDHERFTEFTCQVTAGILPEEPGG